MGSKAIHKDDVILYTRLDHDVAKDVHLLHYLKGIQKFNNFKSLDAALKYVLSVTYTHYKKTRTNRTLNELSLESQ